jgi:hypothetical protein
MHAATAAVHEREEGAGLPASAGNGGLQSPSVFSPAQCFDRCGTPEPHEFTVAATIRCALNTPIDQYARGAAHGR